MGRDSGGRGELSQAALEHLKENDVKRDTGLLFQKESFAGVAPEKKREVQETINSFRRLQLSREQGQDLAELLRRLS